MGPDAQTYGLGLNRAGHTALVITYIVFISLIAGFGWGRMWQGTTAFRQAIAFYMQRASAYSQERREWVEAAKKGTTAPRTSTAAMHLIDGYPPLARRLGQQGTVRLDILVLPSGHVGDVRVERSSGYPQLDAAALVGVGGWYYVPAMRNHRPVSAWTKVNVRFRLMR